MAETTLPATTFFQKVWREHILNVANGTGAVQGGCTVHQNRVCVLILITHNISLFLKISVL